MTKTQVSTGDRDARREMTPKAQRIAIAEACGWKFYCINSLKEIVWHKSVNEKWTDTLVATFDQLPDYLNDLNAMHAAEKVLTHEQKRNYCLYLYETFGQYGAILTTAAQRAEAFLRTLNLWKPDQSEKRDL